MKSPFYNDDTSLTLAGYAELQRLVLGYCNDKSYSPWSLNVQHDNSPDAFELWRQGLLGALADHLRAKVWVQRWTALDGEEKTWLYLSEGEGQAKLKWQGGPIRHRVTLSIIKTEWPPTKQPWHTMPIDVVCLEDLLCNKAGIDELIYRLDKHVVAPYSSADWQAMRSEFGPAISTVWSDMNRASHNVAFASVFFEDTGHGRLAVLLPSAWGTKPDDASGFGSFGKDLRIDPNEMFAFFDSNHRYRFAQLTSPWHPTVGDPMGRAYCVGEASYAYLQTDNCGMGIYEASHEPLQPDQDGDWVCKLVTQGEIQLNNPGHSVLAGSLGLEGCVVKNSTGNSRLVGWMTIKKDDCEPDRQSVVQQRAILRWADLRGSSEGLRPAQDPKSLLWGWADDKGGPAIEPRFASVGNFHHGLAQASDPEDPKAFGLVNRVGDWLMAPQWDFITWSSPRFITVRNDQDEWGAVGFSVDEGGKVVGQSAVVLALQSKKAWLEIFSQQQARDEQRRRDLGKVQDRRVLAESPNMSRTEMIIAAIKRVAQDRAFQTVQQAKQEASLARLAGVFDAAGARDLMMAGVWFMRVRVLRDQESGFQVREGETGKVYFEYPVTLSTYDLNREAPVMGLQSAPHAAIGIAWEDLCCAIEG